MDDRVREEAEASPAAPAAAGAAAEAEAPGTGDGSRLGLVLDVPLEVTVEIGSARMRVREILQLAKGSVIELDRPAGEPADVLVNGRVIARGEVTVVEGRLSVRIVEIVGGS